MRGFAITGNLLLVAGLAAAALVAALSVQSWRLQAAQEALGAEKAAKALAMARIEALGREKAVTEAALTTRDESHDKTRRALAGARARLREAEHDPTIAASLDCPVPEPVRDLLRHRRRGGGQLAVPPAGDPAAGLPAPGARPSNSS